MPVEPHVKRAVSFIDGQNLYRHAKDAFGHHHPNYDPRKHADALCAEHGWVNDGVRFYTGVPSADRSPMWHGYWTRRLTAMRRAGIAVTSRPLRYRVETVRLPDGSVHEIPVEREKGVDLRLGLDVVRMARNGELDVAILFSQDQDLAYEVAHLFVVDMRDVGPGNAPPVRIDHRHVGVVAGLRDRGEAGMDVLDLRITDTYQHHRPDKKGLQCVVRARVFGHRDWPSRVSVWEKERHWWPLRRGRCASGSLEFERGRKYLYRPAGTAFNNVHDVVPRQRWVPRCVWIRTVVKRVLRVFGVDPGRFLAAVRRIAAWATPRPPGRPGQGDANGSDEPTLFFFHFRALNTGWKYPRRVVPIHPDGHVRDERIAAMRVIVDSRHRQPDQDAVPYPALSGD